MPMRPLPEEESEPMSRRMLRSDDSWDDANLLMDGFTLLISVRMGLENASVFDGEERRRDQLARTTKKDERFMSICSMEMWW